MIVFHVDLISRHVKLVWGVYHLTLHATASEYHIKIDDQIIISCNLTIKKVYMIIAMLHDLHSYSYIDLAMHSRPLDSILAAEMIILLCSQ